MAKREFNSNAEIVFTCGEAFHYKGEMMVEEHCLVRVLSGELKVIHADKTYVFGAGETHLFPRNQLATLVKYEKEGLPYKAIVVKLSNTDLKDYYALHPFKPTIALSGKIARFGKSPLLDSFFQSLLPYFELSNKLPENLSKLKITEAITILRTLDKHVDEVLADFSEPGKAELTAFMERNYMFNMPMEKFSYLTGRSITTFKRDFKKAFHTTPQKWLIQKRLELAHHLLKEQRRKPVDIYYETGFENLSHFSFAFKKHFGYAPTQIENK
ncbi:Helix-turn-helix domain-containing protein [Filimonas lacunae]|uniref:Helix-turn-helix domain-containing protein n=1 Tax=Filimonas lacunae TaxID=477680 RepID=A0A173MGR1_9BACT|nr:helix-turn-helix domain-containing protein [Filimonas lacunae]BAV06686.1 type III secretion thermoregulatory protein [Filimonas lacunae]SIT27907.1 Helix-turn-helix domain-containing protein [Filimonas lacunae]